MKFVNTFCVSFLTLATHAFAEEGAQAAKPSLIESLIPFLLIFGMMYFLLIRPQLKKAKDQAKLIKDLKPGDEVLTTGGIIGKIKSVADRFVVLDVGSTTLKVMKEHVTGLASPATASSSSSAPKS